MELKRQHALSLSDHGTLFHGKRASVELIVRVLACLAEGLGIRGTARVFEIDPNTVLGWLVEAAEHLRAFAQYFLHDLHLTQVQLDELYAVLSAVKDGAVSEDQAIERLSHSPQWVWMAMDPESKLLLAIDVGPRTLAMAQRVVHQVVADVGPRLRPTVADRRLQGVYGGHAHAYGHWVQPPRRQATGPSPKPRWMPLPGLLYAQVIKTVRRRRLVHVTHRVVFGTLEAVKRCWRPVAGTSIPRSWKCDPLVERKRWLPGRPQGQYEPCNSVCHEGANPSLPVQE